jgi:hypothetical protein
VTVVIEGGKVYLYKLIADNGGAPCVADQLLSLAICKPIIRKVAKEGSWIFGFAADALKTTHQENRLIYVAKVTKAVLGPEYYGEGSVYVDRGDCIYRWSAGKYQWRAGAAHHKGGLALSHDLGTEQDGFDRARVLLSDYYRYFGVRGPTLSAQHCDPLRLLLGRLTQGHRVNLGVAERNALELLVTQAFGMTGEPSNRTSRNTSSCSGECETGIASDDDDIPEDCYGCE